MPTAMPTRQCGNVVTRTRSTLRYRRYFRFRYCEASTLRCFPADTFDCCDYTATPLQRCSSSSNATLQRQHFIRYGDAIPADTFDCCDFTTPLQRLSSNASLQHQHFIRYGDACCSSNATLQRKHFIRCGDASLPTQLIAATSSAKRCSSNATLQFQHGKMRLFPANAFPANDSLPTPSMPTRLIRV